MKNKIVYFPPSGLPRVISTETPEKFVHLEGKVFINPNLDLVKRTPIEFWQVKGESIVPILDVEARRERLKLVDSSMIMHLQPDAVRNGWEKFEENSKKLQEMLMQVSQSVENTSDSSVQELKTTSSEHFLKIKDQSERSYGEVLEKLALSDKKLNRIILLLGFFIIVFIFLGGFYVYNATKV